MNPKKNNGAVNLVVIAALALLSGLGIWAVKPKALHGESKRAGQSTEATAELLATTKKQSSEAAASVVKIGEANTQQPSGPISTFIGREVGVALSKLGTPDPQALIEAEKRKVAVLEGKVQVINDLYAQALKHSDDLEKARAKAETARREADLKLEQKAAEHIGAERQRNIMLALAGVALGLYLWTKTTHLSPTAIAEVVNDLRSKTHSDPIHALDSAASRIQQKLISRIAKLTRKD